MDDLRVYCDTIGEIPLLTAEEEMELAKEADSGNKTARDLLINSNLKLVVDIAKRYQNCGLEIDDLIQEGNIGLIYAANRYDYTKGFRFLNYAWYIIRGCILNAINANGRNIHISDVMSRQVSKFVKMVNLLADKLGRTPTIDEIVIETGLDISSVNDLYRLLYLDDMLNIDDLILDEEANADILISRLDQSLEDMVISRILPDEIRKLFQEHPLSSEEIMVLELKYGLNGKDVLPTREIADKLNISRDEVRSIHGRTIQKVRKLYHIGDFACYMDNPNKAIKRLARVNPMIKSKMERDSTN